MAHGVKNSKHIFPRSLATLSRMNFNSSLVFLANHEGAQLEILGLLKETHLKRKYNYLLFNYILDHPMRYVFPASCTLNHLESWYSWPLQTDPWAKIYHSLTKPTIRSTHFPSMRITQWLCWCAGVHHMTRHHQAFSPMEVQLLWPPSSGETSFFTNFKWLSGSRSCWEVFL